MFPGPTEIVHPISDVYAVEWDALNDYVLGNSDEEPYFEEYYPGKHSIIFRTTQRGFSMVPPNWAITYRRDNLPDFEEARR